MTAERVTRGFAWNYLYKLVEYGLINLYTILVVRKFGPELAGGYAVYLSISGMLAIIGAFGVDGVLLRYLPRVARGESKIGEEEIEGTRPFIFKLFAFRLAVAAVMSFIVAALLGVLPHLIPSLHQSFGSLAVVWPYLILFLFAQAVTAFSTFTLIGLLKVKWVFFASVISRLTLVTLGFAVIASSRLTLTYAVGLHAFAAAINAAFLLYWIHKQVDLHVSKGLRREAAQAVRQMYRFLRKPAYLKLFMLTPFMLYGLTTWGSDVLATVMGRQPDILMMRAILGENARDIGLYQSAAQLVLMTEYLFLFGLGGTLVSVFSELVHEDEKVGPGLKSKYPRLFQARRDIAGFQGVSTAPIFGFMLVFAPIVVRALYGAKFLDAVPMVMAGLAILGLTVVVFGGGMQVTSLVVIGKERIVFRNRLTWGILNLIANYFLIRAYGGYGAMVGTQLANLGACATEGYFARKYIGESADLKRILTITSIIAVSLGISYWAVEQFTNELPALVQAIVAAFIMAALTIGGYAIFRVPDAKKVAEKVLSIVGRKREPVLNP